MRVDTSAPFTVKNSTDFLKSTTKCPLEPSREIHFLKRFTFYVDILSEASYK